MTANEMKRYGQCERVISESSRTDGERAAAWHIMSRIDAKVSARSRVRNAYTMAAYARTLDIVA
jgi:hypothetical protein